MTFFQSFPLGVEYSLVTTFLYGSSMPKFKTPLVDQHAQPIVPDSFFGSVGFSESYRGTTAEDDSLVVAIRNSLGGEKVSESEQCLLRSFFCEWLAGNRTRLDHVAIAAVELTQSVRFLEQVGFLERTANSVVSGVAGIALSLALLDFVSMAGGDPMVAIASTVPLGLLLPDSMFLKMDKAFGKPGEPVRRADFDAETVFALVRLCKLRSIVANLDLSAELIEALQRLLDRKAFALFLASSRQIEGLAISGSSEASAAVAVHAALALGLTELPDADAIMNSWEEGVSHLVDEDRKEETARTLASVRTIFASDVGAIKAQVSRLLVSSSATEALDMAVVPLKASFQLMGFVASTLAKASPEGHFKMAFESASRGAKFAQSTTDAAPDAVAKTVDAGVSAEVWARNAVARFWKRDDESGEEA